MVKMKKPRFTAGAPDDTSGTGWIPLPRCSLPYKGRHSPIDHPCMKESHPATVLRANGTVGQ